MLEVAGISQRFGGDAVLDDLDLAVRGGTTMSLLGPSGSGKSTLLRIVAGLQRPDAGTVRIAGADVTGVPAHRRGVGFLFQDQALFPHLDVGDNVAFGLRMSGVGRADRRRRVTEVLATVGLPGFEARDPATLSGGEAQRVALARALAPEPAVVLLDEPLAALDQLLRESLLLELRAIVHRLGVTCIAVTHDPTEAATLGDDVAVLLDGRIARSGPASEVMADPGSVRVAGLLGHRNVLSGRREEAGTVSTPLGSLPVAGAAGAVGEEVAVLVPLDALRPATPSSPSTVEATVEGLVFRGGAAHAVVAVGGHRLDVRAGAGWAVGDAVHVAVDPAAVTVLEP